MPARGVPVSTMKPPERSLLRHWLEKYLHGSPALHARRPSDLSPWHCSLQPGLGNTRAMRLGNIHAHWTGSMAAFRLMWQRTAGRPSLPPPAASRSPAHQHQ